MTDEPKVSHCSRCGTRTEDMENGGIGIVIVLCGICRLVKNRYIIAGPEKKLVP